MKIDWNEAPEWANYAAMDAAGYWSWYEHKPALGNYGWLSATRRELVFEYCPPWKDSLMKRPSNAQGKTE